MVQKIIIILLIKQNKINFFENTKKKSVATVNLSKNV